MARSKPERKSRQLSRLRCAIYTRKSSEEGLEQSFNSLDAQREACEAYIASQVGEGWTAVTARYDDGGFSGGSMDRPGLARLLSDIALRKVDVVVVYKVDRLTRSLADFARIVDAFDSNGVSFVSVTQAFNTTTSMGRLTLNVLLSFAQFEREVTGERIRDKIAASKKKGMWMGGTPPLGYRPHERTLVIDEDEAATVRHIFNRYLELGSVHKLKRELDRDGTCTRPSRKTGAPAPFGRGALYHLLSNRIYVGDIVHKDETYPGQHLAIVEPELFHKVQQLLGANRNERRQRTIVAGRAPLAGLIFDSDGRPLSPVSSRKAGGQVYRYYVSAHLQRGGGTGDDEGIRLSAPAVERVVLDCIARLADITDWPSARTHVKRVEIHPDKVQVVVRKTARMRADRLDTTVTLTHVRDDELQVEMPCTVKRWRGQRQIVAPSQTLQRAAPDRTLMRALMRAHSLVRKLLAAPDRCIDEIAAEDGATGAYVRRLVRLAFLAPDLQAAIVEGRQPPRMTLEQLMRIPPVLGWSRQFEMFSPAAWPSPRAERDP